MPTTWRLWWPDVTSIRIRTAPFGTSAWTTRGTITGTPLTCGWDTTAVAH